MVNDKDDEEEVMAPVPKVVLKSVTPPEVFFKSITIPKVDVWGQFHFVGESFHTLIGGLKTVPFSCEFIERTSEMKNMKMKNG